MSVCAQTMLPVLFNPTTLSAIADADFDHYRAALSSPIDSFLEDHIVQSQFYAIATQDMPRQSVGWCAIHQQTLLTQFHLLGGARRYGQAIFRQLRERLAFNAAFVPTCDEFFLSHALDEYAKLEKQAYFFVEGDAAQLTQPSAADVRYRPASVDDIDNILALSGDFIDKHHERIQRRELHVGELGTQLIALGVIERSTLFPAQASIGMFTHEGQRGQGVGRSTLLYLRAVCHAEGARPIAGCWYYNHASKRTLEAAGMVTATRLLRVEYTS